MDYRPRVWLVLAACGALTGCPTPSGPTDTALGSVDTAGACAVSYANFGQAFMVTNCQPCHASETVDRFDAPQDVVFDTEEDVAAWATRILARSVGPEPTMPPAGGVAESDRALLEEWLTCTY